MNRNYIFLTILMIVLAVGTLMLKPAKQLKQIEPETLLKEIVQPTRYISTDEVAKRLIQGDPSLLLVDVRSEAEFEKYSLPRSLNIPTEKLMADDNLSYFGVPGTKVVFVSNDDIKADQTWVLTKRLGFNSTYVMKGGLNCWMETIIDPVEPSPDAEETEFKTYSFRKGAQMYFTGAQVDDFNDSKVEVQVRRKEKTSVASGGC
ncbi:rhodanese-like domain-containing protein [Maribellus maritimus]|uniref:rhodanese-like domain-containing protein n=1 Tax=Maribellus maritimus TaxID=2870838 RepID=UPI001EECA74B|nr:rhodanese-like domain-containing protein [Maribellus maritimus]MCG6186621.1 rhodanese-like domain-containing protein [Maribellus maritimus]